MAMREVQAAALTRVWMGPTSHYLPLPGAPMFAFILSFYGMHAYGINAR
ncbi:MAG: hypothetical protein JSU95_02195 [Betaproteobacteria bacterium]|nr:MAG: hypothetical protein JSU95_02195 [Betaproteobacteria bacterium]